MEIIRNNTNFDFIGKRRYFITASIILAFISILSLIIRGGPRFGIEFTGGAMVQVAFNKDVAIEDLRATVKKTTEGTPVVQAVLGKDREFIIMTEKTTGDMGGIQDVIKSALETSFGKGSVEITQANMVGPKVGDDLKNKGLMALGLSLLCMLVYIWFRFQLDFGVGALIAIFHDVLLMIGYFSVFNKEFDLTFVAAMLTIVGFSMNDTVVVFDRIRELMGRLAGKPVEEIMNRAVNETLSRTILTSLTVVICVVVLLALGGPAVHDFAVALMVGIVAGTYSSIYIASPVVLAFRNWQEKRNKAVAVPS